jgi:DNA repair ATPase RecN
MKKLTGIAVAAVMVLGVYGCGGGSETESSSNSAGQSESKKEVSASDVSEEAYIDVVAHQQVLTTKYTEGVTDPSQMGKAVEKIDSEMNKVLDKHGVTMDEINAYADKFEDNPEAYMATMEKLSARMDELSKEYGVN